MTPETILICGAPAGFPPCLPAALELAFPQVAVTDFPDLATAILEPECPGRKMLVLASETAGDFLAAREQLDTTALPRWAVVGFGKEGFPVEGWAPSTLAPLLREAAARHALERENVRLKGDLLTMARRVSHDLRTPLGGIIATVDMLAETVPSGSALTKPVFSSIDEITRIITRTSLLLRAVAEPAEPQPLAMGAVVSEVIFRLGRLVQSSHATIHQPSTWPEVPAVAGWVELIWTNLLQNALQHGGPSPVITLGWEEDPSGWRFSVQDQGPGPKVRETAGPGGFVPFHVLHDRNAPKGFGLPIVHRLAELMNGKCGYEAAVDGGAVYWFTLPRAA